MKALRVFSILVIGIGILYWIIPTHITIEKPPVSQHENYGAPAIGGDFSLTNMAGETFTNKDLEGHYSLVFFGFTLCPDVCPVAVATLSDVMNQLGDDAEQVIPVFITIDPERDTPEKLKDYMSSFNPALVALTGSADQTRQVQKAYHVYAQKQPLESNGENDYSMNHSSFIYMLDKQGKYIRHFSHDVSADKLLTAVSQVIATDMKASMQSDAEH